MERNAFLIDDRMQQATVALNAMSTELGKAFVGSEDTRNALVAAVAADGHILAEGDPGTGKTFIAKKLAEIIGGDFSRIQGDPDVMPTDITGLRIFDRQTGQFDFQPGPILLGNVVLIDEASRMNSKSQSAFLQPLFESHVTVDNIQHPVKDPFIVIATQNPHEINAGTYPMTEAQKDRFLLGLSFVPYSKQERLDILEKQENPIGLSQVVPLEQFIALKGIVRSIFASPNAKALAAGVSAQLVDLQRRSDTDLLTFPGGSRSTTDMLRLGKALAVLANATEVGTAHIAQAAYLTLPHRMGLKIRGRSSHQSPQQFVADALKQAA